MNWLQLGGSIVAILVLTGIAWALKLGGGGIADEPAALQLADDALSGFSAVQAIVSTDRAAAIVFDATGRVALLKRHGAHIAAREVSRPLELGPGPQMTGVSIATGDRWFGPVALYGVNAESVRALEASLTSV